MADDVTGTAKKGTNSARKGLGKVPKWGWVLGGVVVVGGVWYYKKHHTEATKGNESNSTPAADQGLTNQAFIPVTGEGGGAGAGGGGIAGGSGSNDSELLGLLTQNQKEAREQQKEQSLENRQFQAEQNQSLREYLSGMNSSNKESLQSITERLTGGGTPSSPAPPGQVSSAPPPTQSAPPAPPPKPACSGSFPHQGPHGCYKDITCGNGCPGHKYASGLAECSTKKSKNSPCAFP